MIDKDTFIPVILKKAKSLPIGNCLDIRTYKRNRSVLLIREGEDSYRIIENGFYKNEFRASFKELRKIFKKLLKLEFPRSHKIRVYKMGRYTPLLLFFLFLLTKILFASSLPDCFKKADAINDYVYKTYYVKPDGSYKMILRMQISIKTYKGKKDWADFKYPYNSEYEKVIVEKAETILPSGKIVKVSKKEIQDILNPSTSKSSIYSKARLKVINFPSVDVGAKIRLKIKLKSKIGFWAKESFRLINPTVVKQVKVIIPSDMKIFFRLNDPIVKLYKKKEKGKLIYIWEGWKLSPLYEDPFSPPIENQPFCLIISSFSQKDVSSFFYKRLLSPIKEDHIKIPAWAKANNPDTLYKEMLTHISIYPINLFDTYLKPQRPKITLKKAYGRPLDLAILFRKILKEKGIDAHLVLVNTEGIFIKPLRDTIFPSLFNQVFVYAKKRFYSFEDKDIPPSITSISGSIGLDIESYRFIQVKNPVISSFSKELSIRIYPQGDGIGNLKEEFFGASTIPIRKMLRNKKGRELEIRIYEILHRIDPEANILGNFHSDGIEDLSDKALINFRFSLDPVFMRSDQLYLFPIPSSELLAPYLRCTLDRHYGISVFMDQKERILLRIYLPKDIKPLIFPSSIEGKTGLLSWKIKTSYKKGEITFLREIILHRGIISKKEAIKMIKKVRELNRISEKMMIFTD